MKFLGKKFKMSGKEYGILGISKENNVVCATLKGGDKKAYSIFKIEDVKEYLK